MLPDHPPIPREALPPGWGLTSFCDDEVIYRHRNPLIDLVAESTPADRSHPRLGLCRCWALRYRYELGEQFVVEPIGRVATRRAAVDGILECMELINASIDDIADPVALHDLLSRVRLSDGVPEL
ncbi:hypothetical protein SAMN04487967_3209 [Natronorubrum sediminis]|uniref:Uncharacterized protein n=1 Tax=Natronorubrum sediminis TaxID=640943 RepID=A0A1H6G4H0_9EURY|nr:hypothetical protein [Natronorubrum sediminis]SEH17492.1 hypothetical protein SAMN04487967_3209 [Natronorubrum sediminis]